MLLVILLWFAAVILIVGTLRNVAALVKAGKPDTARVAVILVILNAIITTTIIAAAIELA